tara:strand:- start:952 stop:4881 length:3930 start_codon:yes stop_codon:yes gene_type:complete
MTKYIKLFDYETLNEPNIFEEGDGDNKDFIIQVFGSDKNGKSYCLYINNFRPFFYVKVDDTWNINKKEQFLQYIIERVSTYKNNYYKNSILECKLVKKKKLYGFDAGKTYKFIYFKFKNIIIFNKVKNLWFEYVVNKNNETKKVLNEIEFMGTKVKIYESSIPPLLRFFHLKNISPSGWIKFQENKVEKSFPKKTTCDYEYIMDKEKITSLNKKEETIPLKICSFDIEASSSHGDFPVPIKNYKKLADNILEYWHYNNVSEESREDQAIHFRKIIKSAFNVTTPLDFIAQVYPKKSITKKELNEKTEKCLNKPMKELNKSSLGIETENLKVTEWCLEQENIAEQSQEGENKNYNKHKSYLKNKITILDLLNDTKFKREDKVIEITRTLDIIFPRLEGDKVTFIGSTFWKYGDNSPYLNHCIVLGESSPIENVVIENKPTEKKALLAWTKLIQKENPDIIVGYNTFGFDYMFMFNRAKELETLRDFLKLSKNKNEICGKFNKTLGEYTLNESTHKIASGTHELKFIKMTGRINIDLYNYFRREYNLISYKLDNIASNFIGDFITDYEYIENNKTQITSKNLKGLIEESFIKFEEIGHSSDSYNEGEKFKVLKFDKSENTICINGQPTLNKTKILKWGLAKDDVTPQDIFRLTETGKAEDKAIVAKYCVQDCNLLHYLMNKIDILTGYVEMSNICSVPINYLVMRGQGIKLYSFISKRCRELNTLIPDLNKFMTNDGYEGATVLIPKTDLYLDEPVAVVDYSSLYPSSIISENLSHDSKVWTKEYNLDGELIKETGSSKYDNLSNYKYIDVEFDTYKYIPNQRGKMIKTISGKKICRWAQFPDGQKGIIPSILEELLAARKATRTMAKFKTLTTTTNETHNGIVKQNENTTIVTNKNKVTTINNEDIVSIKDTYDDFMKNIFDKRQQGYKITANSTYGIAGAKTSDFYEPDVAASTTAVGRMLLLYGKRIIEEVYGDKICNTSYGTVHSHAEYIYGDTDSVFMSFKLTDLEGKPIKGKDALKITIELAKEAGELATKFLKKPHDLEYEKTFMPFALLSKKRYVGMLYKEDPNKSERKSMGIVLKRRDNAPIVKDIYGGVIDILMEVLKEDETETDKIVKAMNFTRQFLQDMVNEKFSTSKLIISKSIRSFYKNPQSIAHKVLADRMGIRDSGNKPRSGDRIPFMYIQTKGKVKLQGDKIEHPDFIEKNKLKPDYGFYITNQIMKPLLQVFALVLYKMPEFKRKSRNFQNKLEILKQTLEEDKYIEKESKLKNKEVEKILFEEVLRKVKNKKEGDVSITDIFKGLLDNSYRF